MSRIAWPVTGVGSIVAAYLWWRPQMLTWGATDVEASESLPGDEQTPSPRLQSTRAITIDAPPERVWPWLVQMGIGRAGFYTHDWLERLLFRARYVDGRRSAVRIHPEFQDLRPGDPIYMGSGAYTTVTQVEPERHLVTFETFVLRPLDGRRTRLIARTRGMGYLQPALSVIAPDAGRLPRLIRLVVGHLPGVDRLARGFDFFFADPLHHYMDTGMLKGIKRRVEASSEKPWRCA
ncbi:MAG TPA: hypothetical protein VFX41_02705 [Actinomycetales bacterium]|nr:hypothetical protein [Actinomycetales bacterium]